MRILGKVAILGVMLVTGCAAPIDHHDPTTTTSSSSSSSSSIPTGTPDPPTTSDSPTTDSDTPLHFGHTATWDDGLAITLSKPRTYKPTEVAAGADQFKTSVVFTITLTNGTPKAFDPVLFQIKCTSGDVECSKIFDTTPKGGDIGPGPSAKVLPNRKVVWPVAFNVKNPKDLIIEIRPSFDYKSVIFTY